MESYIFYAWMTNIFYGLSTVVGKLSSKHHLRNPWQLNFMWGLLLCVLSLPFAFYYRIGLPTHWGPMLLFSLFNALSGILWIFSLNLLDVSILSPLYSLRVVFSLLLGVIFFQEHLTPLQYGLIAILCFAGVFVSIDEHSKLRSFFRGSILIALAAVMSSAIFGATTKYALRYDGFWEVSVWGNILAQIMYVWTIPFFWKDLKKTPLKKYRAMVVAVVAAFIAFLAGNKAFAANVSITSAILSVPMSMIMALVFAMFAPSLLEKHTLKIYVIRFIAAGVMLVAALRLSA